MQQQCELLHFFLVTPPQADLLATRGNCNTNSNQYSRTAVTNCLPITLDQEGDGQVNQKITQQDTSFLLPERSAATWYAQITQVAYYDHTCTHTIVSSTATKQQGVSHLLCQRHFHHPLLVSTSFRSYLPDKRCMFFQRTGLQLQTVTLQPLS